MIKNPFIRFILLAIGLFLSWFFLFEYWISDHTNLDRFIIENLIDISGGILEALGFTLIAEPPSDIIIRTIGIDGTTGVWVGDPCNGLEIMAIFSIFMIAIPGPWKHKVWFIPLGIVFIHLLNAIRVALLAWVVTKDYAYLDFNHDYTFKIVVFSAVFLLWIFWVRRFVSLKIKEI